MNESDIKLVKFNDVVGWLNNDSNDEVVIFDSGLGHSEAVFPVRFDALVVMLVEEATGSLEINLQNYELKPGSLMLQTPKDYLTGVSEGLKGRAKVMMCSNHVVEHVLPKIRRLLPLIVNYVEQPVITLTEEQQRLVLDMMSLIERLIAEPDSYYRSQKLDTMTQTILLEFLELRYIDSRRRRAQTTRKEEIFSRFLRMVGENFKSCRTVQFYAHEMCVTPKHLTSTVKEVSQRTAREWIDDFVIMEARQLLRDSTLTIQEISERLHFANQSFFGKYFKNLTGESPSAYRRRL